MKKIFFIIPLVLFLLSNFITIVNAAEDDFSYSNEQKYELYKQRVKTICEKYLYENKDLNGNRIKLLLKIPSDNNPIGGYTKIDDDTSYSFEEDIRDKHINNMNNIYNCALLNVQLKSLGLIKNDLIPKNATLSKNIKSKINLKINGIKSELKNNKCISGNEKTSIQKLAVLHQATYQTCKYVNYIEYLREHNSSIKNIIPTLTGVYSISEVKKLERKKSNQLDEELEHVYKVFPIAFHAYTEYENNITAHFLLELIRDDYLAFMEKLHNVLNPINQVVYKISNAMKK